MKRMRGEGVGNKADGTAVSGSASPWGNSSNEHVPCLVTKRTSGVQFLIQDHTCQGPCDLTHVKKRAQNWDLGLIPGVNETQFTTEEVISEWRPLASKQINFSICDF